MKSFSGLQAYASTNRLKPFPTNLHANPFAKNTARKTGPPSQQMSRGAKGVKQIQRMSRSIEEVPIYEERDLLEDSQPRLGRMHSSRRKGEILIENCEEEGECAGSAGQIYGSSYRKIKQMREKMSLKQNKSEIQEELVGILSLIRREREHITHKMQELERSKEPLAKSTLEVSTNTDQIIFSKEETLTHDAEVQMQGREEEEKGSSMADSTTDGDSRSKKAVEREREEQNNEVYMKLASMLDEMNINCKDILPDDIEISHLSLGREYKELSEGEVIRVQKFFIQKLAEKIQKDN